MGFFLQLRLLLWKNITLKKRSPFVLLFEVCIPLVLFVILLLIRKEQPSIPIRAGGFDARPLPSSGVIPIMQSFCDNWELDKYNFKVFKESSTSVLLEKLQTVAENHKFFHAGYTPNEMDTLPTMYERIIDDPAFLHDQFSDAQDFSLSSGFQNLTKLTSFLQNNLSLSMQDIDTLLSSKVHVHEVYHLLFGEDLDNGVRFLNRVRRDVPQKLLPSASPSSLDLQFIPKLLESYLFSNDSDISHGILAGLLQDEGIWKNKEVVTLVMQYLVGAPDRNKPFFLSPEQTAELLKLVLFSPSVLRWVTCDSDELTNVLIPQSSQNVSVLKNIKQQLCNISDLQMTGLSALLKQQISDQFIIEKLNLQKLDIASTVANIEEFIHELQKFYEFQTTLYELSKLAEFLPQDACNSFFSNSTDLPLTDVTMDTNSTSNHTGSGDRVPPDPSKKKNDGDSSVVPHKFAGLLKVWNVMQKTICGKTSPTLPKDRVNHDLENLDWTDLGISSGQRDQLQIVVHVLYNNPKVLYAPSNATNSTPADIIIRKSSKSQMVTVLHPRSGKGQPRPKKKTMNKHHIGKMGQHYIVNDKDRTNTTSKRKTTIIKKAQEFHTTTGNDVYVEFEMKSGTRLHWGTKFFLEKYQKDDSTKKPGVSTIPEPLPSTSTSFPSPESSPQEKTLEKGTQAGGFVGKDCCREYGGAFSEDDANVTWIGCESDACDFWAHAKCVGIFCKLKRHFNFITFYCPQHR